VIEQIKTLATMVVVVVGILGGAVLIMAAMALLIGFWPLALLVAAGALFALAKWAAGVRD
jgi:hypothetical protein